MVVCKYFQQGYCRYGQSCRFEHVYGSKYSYRANQNTGNPSDQNAYNSRASSPPSYSNNSAASIFRSAMQSPQISQPMFESPPNRVSVFARLGSEHNAQNAKSLFAQANQNVFSQSNFQNNFNTHSPKQTDAKSLFSQASQNVFGQTHYAQSNPANVFGQASASHFGQNISKSAVPSTGNVFQISDKPSSIFGMANNSFEQMNEDESIYSKVEELPEADLEAFKSEVFKLGYIPELPPPKSLCV